MKLGRLFFTGRPPTPLQIAVRDLEDAQVIQLAEHKLAEYHAATVRMLDARIARLRVTVRRLTEEQQEGQPCA